MSDEAKTPLAGSRRGVLAIWLFVAAVIVGLGTASLLIVRSLEADAAPEFLTTDLGERSKVDRGEDAALHLAGSGTNLPLTRILAAAYAELHPEAPVVVHPSIGSSGGVAAVGDGAIDIALISRSLKDGERSRNLVAHPYARNAVVFAANPTVPVDNVDGKDILRLYSGQQLNWGDGSRVVVLQRERGDSNHRAVHALIPGMAEVDETAWNEHHWRVLYHDKGMQDALVSTTGAIGLFDQGAVVAQDLPLKVLSFDGVRPTEASVLAGAYPLVKTLSFVTPPSAQMRSNVRTQVESFLAFVQSADGRHLIRESGYIPFRQDGVDE